MGIFESKKEILAAADVHNAGIGRTADNIQPELCDQPVHICFVLIVMLIHGFFLFFYFI